MQEPNRWWGHGGESIRLYQARVRSERGTERVVAWGRIEHTRKGIEQACARTEQVVGVMVDNRTVLCKNRTGGGGHGGESIRLYQARTGSNRESNRWWRGGESNIPERESNRPVQDPNRWWRTESMYLYLNENRICLHNN